MAARAAAFSDPEVITLLRSAFIPVAVNCNGLQRGPGPDGEYFRLIAEQGHYAGRTHPTDTRQGLYCATPAGELLASCNVRQAKPLLETLARALRAAGAPRGAWDAPAAEDATPHGVPPQGGMVLRAWSRDLPRPDAPAEQWHARAFNLDHVWIQAREMAELVPETAGSAGPWPRELACRIARFHLLDNVRGETPPWPLDAVRSAAVETTVRQWHDHGARLEFTGAIRLEHTHRWRTDHDGTPMVSEAGMDLELGGSADWDGGAFRAFELVAVGSRWGATQYNARADDPGPAPIGFVFELAAPGRPGGLRGDDRPPARLSERYRQAVG